MTGISVRTPAQWYGIARSCGSYRLDCQGNRILLGVVALGHRAELRKAGTRSRSREHTPTEASRPSASGPVGVEAGLAGSIGDLDGVVRPRGHRGGPACRKSCFHGTRWPGSGPTAVVVALGPCVMPSRPPSAKPLWWACIRSDAAFTARRLREFRPVVSMGPQSPAHLNFMMLCNAACAKGCRLIGLFRSRIGCPIVVLPIISYIYSPGFDSKQNAIALVGLWIAPATQGAPPGAVVEL